MNIPNEMNDAFRLAAQRIYRRLNRRLLLWPLHSIDKEIERTLDYEKDPRFIRYMKMRFEKAIEDHEAGRFIDADVVFKDIRNRHSW